MSDAGPEYLNALQMHNQGLVIPALEMLDAQLELDAADAWCLQLKGVILAELGDAHGSILAINRAGGIQPLTIESKLVLAECYFATGNDVAAKNTYDKLFNIIEFPVEYLCRLAAGLGKTGSPLAAIDVCKRAVAEDPGCHRARYGVAYYMAKADYPPEFIYPVIRSVIDLAPEIFHYRMAAATILRRMGRHDHAYLTVADATSIEINTVDCRCCFRRLSTLYKNAGDIRRHKLCESRLKTCTSNCNDF